MIFENVVKIAFLGIMCIIFVYILVYEFIIPDLQQKKKNRDWIKQNGVKTRKLCIKCKFSVKKKYHPFPYGEYRNAMVQILPIYCKKFKKHLNCKYNCRCISTDNSEAFYED